MNKGFAFIGTLLAVLFLGLLVGYLFIYRGQNINFPKDDKSGGSEITEKSTILNSLLGEFNYISFVRSSENSEQGGFWLMNLQDKTEKQISSGLSKYPYYYENYGWTTDGRFAIYKNSSGHLMAYDIEGSNDHILYENTDRELNRVVFLTATDSIVWFLNYFFDGESVAQTVNSVVIKTGELVEQATNNIASCGQKLSPDMSKVYYGAFGVAFCDGLYVWDLVTGETHEILVPDGFTPTEPQLVCHPAA